MNLRSINDSIQPASTQNLNCTAVAPSVERVSVPTSCLARSTTSLEFWSFEQRKVRIKVASSYISLGWLIAVETSFDVDAILVERWRSFGKEIDNWKRQKWMSQWSLYRFLSFSGFNVFKVFWRLYSAIQSIIRQLNATSHPELNQTEHSVETRRINYTLKTDRTRRSKGN